MKQAALEDFLKNQRNLSRVMATAKIELGII